MILRWVAAAALCALSGFALAQKHGGDQAERPAASEPSMQRSSAGADLSALPAGDQSASPVASERKVRVILSSPYASSAE